VAPGFRLCPAPAQTILESGHDHGSFRGTAIYVDGEEVVLVCELQAGWYRYVSYWRLHADGTIRPRFGFGAVDNSCVCNRHHHHVYWRLDFDGVDATENGVREFNDPPVSGTSKWHSLDHEIRRERNPQRQRRWRVVNREGDERYTLVPGASDGHADNFGVGDLWALRKRPGEIDDGVGFTQDPQEARAHLNRFLTGQSISRADVVLWYAAHFAHDVHEEGGGGHIVGPKLEPGGW
jgi:Cu2+-containing amine oxidase